MEIACHISPQPSGVTVVHSNASHTVQELEDRQLVKEMESLVAWFGSPCVF